MKNIYSFTKKELFESWRTSRILILVVIFLIFGIMNPLFAKFTPEILKSVGGSAFQIDLPKPTSVDSWTQFYKNITQMGLIIIALMFSGSVSNEVGKGTLVQLVTKGLERSAIILGKLISLVLQWTLCLALCFGVTWGYTLFYFLDKLSPHIFLAVIPLWVFGLFLIALVILCSTISRNSYEGLLVTGGSVMLLYLINIVEKAKHYNPISLISVNMGLLSGSEELGDYGAALGIAAMAAVGMIVLAVYVMDRKKL